MKRFVVCLAIVGVAVNLAHGQQGYYDVTAGDGNGIRFWQDDSYKIHMGNTAEYHYGPVSDYSIKTNMSGYHSGRGWTWGVIAQTPVAAINMQGHMRIAGSFTTEGGIFFNQSGNASDGFPYARFNEAWGIRFNSPDTRWVFSSKPTVLIGYLPTGQDWGSDNLRVAGNVGIGTTSSTVKLTVYNQGGSSSVVIGNPDTASGGYTSLSMGTSADMNGYTYLNSIKASGSAYADFIINKNGGKVGIGTTSPDQLLTVNGAIHSKEVKVDLSVPAPDYVFEKDYKLTSLDSIKTYIDQHKHLPDVPSAQEMEANGVQLGEMNMLLLKKVEELTLYIIELEKRVEKIEQ